MVGLLIFDLFSMGLLSLAVIKLNTLCNKFAQFSESRLIVGIILAVFTFENLSLIACLSIGYAFAKQQTEILYLWASISFIISLIAAVTVLILFVVVIIELSKNQKTSGVSVRDG